MANRVLSSFNRALRRFGYEVRRAPTRRRSAGQGFPSGARLYVGCGEDRREGFLGCDHRPLDTVDLVCKAWEVSLHGGDAAEIYTRHMLEHLTFAEAQAALADWFDALAPGGRLHIVVPDLDAHIEQWKAARWNVESWADTRSDAAWSAAGFYGWQQDCDPRRPGYETSYSDVHKSGYNRASLAMFLERAGFEQVRCDVVDDVHLHAHAVKPGT